jgi:hypothetical protein
LVEPAAAQLGRDVTLEQRRLADKRRGTGFLSDVIRNSVSAGAVLDGTV